MTSARDSKRGQNGFPALAIQDPSAGPHSGGELPPPTYEEATSTVAGPSSGDDALLSPGAGGASVSRHSSYASSSHAIQHQSLNASLYAPSTAQSASVSRATSFASTAPTSSHSRSASIAALKGKEPASPISPTTSSTSHAPPAPGDDVRPRSPPLSFSRPPPPNLPYGAFLPAVHYARSADLAGDGFELAPPTCAGAPGQPHPFVTHDIAENDWARFLADVQGAGGLEPVNAVVAGAAPTVAVAGLLGGESSDVPLPHEIDGGT